MARQARSTTPIPPPRKQRARRAALGEVLLLGDDERACAERTLTWLAERAGADAAICLALDDAATVLRPIAARGVEGAGHPFLHGLSLADTDHPLIRALHASPATSVLTREPSLPPPFERSAAIALPLTGQAPGADDRAPSGLLLVAGKALSRPRARRAARLLGQRLAQILGTRRLARDGESQALVFERIQRASSELEHRAREASAELIRQNDTLREQAAELERASHLRSQFLANVSHEFRTPLNAILGYTSMLLQGVQGAPTPQQTRALTRVESNARHLLAIINDVLDITRIESGHAALHVAEVALPDVIAEVLAELAPEVDRSGLSVTCDIPQGLPTVQTDRQKLKQVVLKLLSNALKFTPRGEVRVALAHEPAMGMFSVAVRDTGIGIADQDQARVFEDFAQVDGSPTRAFGGAGLGLALGRRLAAALGGKITLSSRLGEGSTFTLVAPSRVRPT